MYYTPIEVLIRQYANTHLSIHTIDQLTMQPANTPASQPLTDFLFYEDDDDDDDNNNNNIVHL